MKLFSKKPALAESHLKVEDMNCGACQAHVSKALQGVAGVESVNVDYQLGQATIIGNADLTALIEAVTKAGYTASSA